MNLTAKLPKLLAGFGSKMLLVLSALPLADADNAPRLSITDCVRQSLAANHPLLVRDAEAGAAAARAKGGTAARMPRIFAQGGLLHTNDPLRLTPATENNQPGVFTRDTWQLALGVAMPLYTGGRLSAEEAAARLLEDAAGGDLAHARQSLAAQIVALYQDVLAFGEVILAQQQSRDSLQAQSQRIQSLIDQQKAAEVDLLRVSVRLASVEQFLIEARNRQSVTMATISVLMGRDPALAWQPADTLQMPPAPREIEVASLTTLRADEIAAQARAAAAAELTRAARAGYRPNIDAVAGYGTRADFHDGDHAESGFVGLQLTWNIWDFDRTRAKVTEASEKQRAFDEAAAETTLRRRLELANARANLRAAAARIEASRASVEQARESLRIEERKYELGQGTITDVLDATAAADEAAALRARALADHTTALAARDLALGTIFTPAASVPALQGDSSQAK